MTNAEIQTILNNLDVAKKRQAKESSRINAVNDLTVGKGADELVIIEGKESKALEWQNAYKKYVAEGVGHVFSRNMEGISMTLGRSYQIGIQNVSVEQLQGNDRAIELVKSAIDTLNKYSDKVDSIIKSVPVYKEEVVDGKIEVVKEGLLDKMLPASFSPATKKAVAFGVVAIALVAVVLVIKKLKK